jgi:SAM-dependent methyltransferase
MINIANSKKTSDKVDFYEMNMTEIESFKEQSFDLIYSIGNSIVHLNTLEEIKKFVLSAFYLLKPRGEFILQIVNYDRILDKQVSSLPTISNANLTMTREYTLHQGKILFKTLLDVEGFAYENEVKLLPLRSDELISILLEAGFARYEQYGDFVGSSFNRLESMSLVIKAFK